MRLCEYNGWTNWDTWNTYNWLTESEGIYKEARRVSGPNEMRQLFIDIFGADLNPKDDIDIDEVNWDEVYESFNE